MVEYSVVSYVIVYGINQREVMQMLELTYLSHGIAAGLRYEYRSREVGRDSLKIH